MKMMSAAALVPVTDTAMRPFRFRMRQKVVPLPARVSLRVGIAFHMEKTDLQAIAHECLYHDLIRLLESIAAPHFHAQWCGMPHEIFVERFSGLGLRLKLG